MKPFFCDYDNPASGFELSLFGQRIRVGWFAKSDQRKVYFRNNGVTRQIGFFNLAVCWKPAAKP
jgi:hypothetical protein